MAVIKPFVCIRPNEAVVSKVAALPYDVYNRTEAKREVEKQPLSFLSIDRAETAFSDDVDIYADCVYDKAKSLLEERKNDGIFVSCKTACYYLYELTMNGRMQTGIVAVSSIDDYINGVVKKHENTREEKEIDRIRHVDTCQAQTGPIFLAYRKDKAIADIVTAVKKGTPLYDFVSDDEIGHRIWEVKNEIDICGIEYGFLQVECTYIADGHHRAASAVKVGMKRRKEHKNYKGDEPFNYFLSVLFPEDELMILPYNRVVKDLNGLSKDEFLAKVSNICKLEKIKEKNTKTNLPVEKGNITMLLEGEWYLLKFDDKNESNPVDVLDVSILQNEILRPILGIEDPRTDNRIEFIGGIRGNKELEYRVNKDMKVAFSMYPTSIEELLEVADAGLLMPPKSTWFEPKLRSGLFIHQI